MMDSKTNRPAAQNADSAKIEMPPGEMRQIVLKEIGSKWGKFSEQDLNTLKGKDDLVNQVVAKYGFEKGKAHSDVETLLKGRAF